MGEIIAVTGTDGGVGATTTTVLLGGGTGERRRDTGILDVTVEGSRISDVLDVEPDDRLPDATRGDPPLREFKQDGPHGLSIYAGSDGVPWDDITAEGVESLYDRLRDRHELTFVDCDSPGTPTSSLWIAHADTLVIVTDSIDTASGPIDAFEPSELEAAADAFGCSIAGLVVNRIDEPEAALDAVAPDQLLAVLPDDPVAPGSAEALQTPYRYDPDSPIADTGWRLAGQFDGSPAGGSVELPAGTVEPEAVEDDSSETAPDTPLDSEGTEGNDAEGDSLVSGSSEAATTADRQKGGNAPEPTTAPPSSDDTIVAEPPTADSAADRSESTVDDDGTPDPEPLGAPGPTQDTDEATDPEPLDTSAPTQDTDEATDPEPIDTAEATGDDHGSTGPVPFGTPVETEPPDRTAVTDESASDEDATAGGPPEPTPDGDATASGRPDPSVTASEPDSLHGGTDESEGPLQSSHTGDEPPSGDRSRASIADDNTERSMVDDSGERSMAEDNAERSEVDDDSGDPSAEQEGDRSGEADVLEEQDGEDVAFEFDTAVEQREEPDLPADDGAQAPSAESGDDRSIDPADIDENDRPTEGLRDRVESLASQTMTLSVDIEESTIDADELSELSDDELRSLLIELGVPGEVPEYVTTSVDALDANGVPPAVSDSNAPRTATDSTVSSSDSGSVASNTNVADSPAATETADTSERSDRSGESSDSPTGEGDTDASARNIRSVVEVIVEDTEAKAETESERTVRIPAEEIDDGGIPIDIESAMGNVAADIDAADIRLDEAAGAALLDGEDGDGTLDDDGSADDEGSLDDEDSDATIDDEGLADDEDSDATIDGDRSPDRED